MYNYRISPITLFACNIYGGKEADPAMYKNAQCEKYPTWYGAHWSQMPNGYMNFGAGMYQGGVPVIAIRDSSFGDDTVAFRNSLKGVYLYYELDSPIQVNFTSNLQDTTLPLLSAPIDMTVNTVY